MESRPRDWRLGSGCIRLSSFSSVPNARKRIISIVRFARRNTLFYDEDITALPRLVSAVYVGMKAMEISRYGRMTREAV
jgi:hypothetical protein